MLFKVHALLLIALLLAILPSCSMMRSIELTAAKAAELIVVVAENMEAATGTLTEAKATYAQAKAEADTDGDGETSMSEWATYMLLGGGGLGGLGALAKGAIRNAKSDGRKDIIEARLNAIESTSS